MVITGDYNRNEKKHKYLLDGLLFCYECKHKIGVRCKKSGYITMVCNNYRRNSKLGLCTSHGFNYEKLKKMVLDYIKELFVLIDSKEIEKNIKDFLRLDKPTLEIMKVIINRIEIHQDKQVDIYFNFKKLNDIVQNAIKML